MAKALFLVDMTTDREEIFTQPICMFTVMNNETCGLQ